MGLPLLVLAVCLRKPVIVGVVDTAYVPSMVASPVQSNLGGTICPDGRVAVLAGTLQVEFYKNI